MSPAGGGVALRAASMLVRLTHTRLTRTLARAPSGHGSGSFSQNYERNSYPSAGGPGSGSMADMVWTMVLGMLGIMAGLWSEKFDHMSAVTNFVIMPMTFLSGTFYLVDKLPEPFRSASHFNPFFYMIDGFRYGFIGHAEGSLLAGVGLVAGTVIADQLTWTVFINCAFFWSTTVMETGDSSLGIKAIQDKLWPTLKVNWVVWPVLQTINLGFVPLEYRLLYINIASLFWSAYLSKMAATKTESTPTGGTVKEMK
jgi:hypothetical protein